MRRFGRKRISIIFFIFIFLWMISPVILPNDYSGLSGEEREVAEAAVRETDMEWGLPIQRFSIENITKSDSEWGVEVVQYTIFNIPVAKATHTIVPSISKVWKYHSISGSFRMINPHGFWVYLLSILTTYLIIFSTLVLTFYYLIRKKKKRVNSE
ncbi:MAG: hypothetical protein R6U44_09625 [Archaeoglobaceae archaeon]